jgi:DNA-binding helix-hairpin-helix protein with protein kinase domain
LNIQDAKVKTARYLASSQAELHNSLEEVGRNTSTEYLVDRSDAVETEN